MRTEQRRQSPTSRRDALRPLHLRKVRRLVGTRLWWEAITHHRPTPGDPSVRVADRRRSDRARSSGTAPLPRRGHGDRRQQDDPEVPGAAPRTPRPRSSALRQSDVPRETIDCIAKEQSTTAPLSCREHAHLEAVAAHAGLAHSSGDVATAHPSRSWRVTRAPQHADLRAYPTALTVGGRLGRQRPRQFACTNAGSLPTSSSRIGGD